jgi:hypothetical protein
MAKQLLISSCENRKIYRMAKNTKTLHISSYFYFKSIFYQYLQRAA